MVHPYLRRREGKEQPEYPTPELEAVLQAAYAAAKRVRSETPIAEGATSLAAAAIQVARVAKARGMTPAAVSLLLIHLRKGVLKQALKLEKDAVA